MTGHLLTVWTIRLALVCYAVYLAGWLSGASRRDCRWPAMARWLWTVGCGLFVVHVASAFHFTHGWSHAAALEATAEDTEALLGVRFGEGIYFSYAFLVLWVADVAAAWLGSGVGSSRPMVWNLGLAVHAYLFFIAFNGAIVFESGPTRWAGLAVCTVLAGLAGRAAYNWLAERGAANSQRGADVPVLNPEP